MFRLHTPRLLITELANGDAGFIVELLNSPGFLEHIGDRGVRNQDDALAYLAQGPLASYAAHGFGLWKVALASDGTAIGLCGLLRRETLPDPDLGYAFLPAHAGQGYATEAAAAVLGHGFGPLAMARVLAIVSPGNDASMRLLEKLGFTREGTQEIDGRPLVVFAAAPADRQGRR